MFAGCRASRIARILFCVFSTLLLVDGSRNCNKIVLATSTSSKLRTNSKDVDFVHHETGMDVVQHKDRETRYTAVCIIP